MIEGWSNDEYFVLFDKTESHNLTKQYSIQSSLPGFSLLGLVGWDDLLLKKGDRIYTCPTVPIDPEYLKEIQSISVPETLVPDARLIGKIKWYTTPLIFGGDPEDEQNMQWVDLEHHIGLVKWWNGKYSELKE